MKDRSYRATPLGLEVARYRRWKQNEWGATETTLRDYEAILARLALDHADLELQDFQPPIGTERLREFLDDRWGDRTPRTRAKVLSVLKDFFAWSCLERGLVGNPTLPIRRPKQRAAAHGTFSDQTVIKIIAGQPRLRDRVALMLLLQLGLRKGELGRVQFKHYDGHTLTVYGKGGKVRQIPLSRRLLREGFERHVLERQAAPDEYLLFPEKVGPPLPGMPAEVIWSDRFAPMTSTTLHRWWTRCLKRAGVPHQRMHDARHTAITALLRVPGANLKHAQQLAGHTSIQTTADIYAHFDVSDLAGVMRDQDEP